MIFLLMFLSFLIIPYLQQNTELFLFSQVLLTIPAIFKTLLPYVATLPTAVTEFTAVLSVSHVLLSIFFIHSVYLCRRGLSSLVITNLLVLGIGWSSIILNMNWSWDYIEISNLTCVMLSFSALHYCSSELFFVVFALFLVLKLFRFGTSLSTHQIKQTKSVENLHISGDFKFHDIVYTASQKLAYPNQTHTVTASSVNESFHQWSSNVLPTQALCLSCALIISFSLILVIRSILNNINLLLKKEVIPYLSSVQNPLLTQDFKKSNPVDKKIVGHSVTATWGQIKSLLRLGVAFITLYVFFYTLLPELVLLFLYLVRCVNIKYNWNLLQDLQILRYFNSGDHIIKETPRVVKSAILDMAHFWQEVSQTKVDRSRLIEGTTRITNILPLQNYTNLTNLGPKQSFSVQEFLLSIVTNTIYVLLCVCTVTGLFVIYCGRRVITQTKLILLTEYAHQQSKLNNHHQLYRLSMDTRDTLYTTKECVLRNKFQQIKQNQKSTSTVVNQSRAKYKNNTYVGIISVNNTIGFSRLHTHHILTLTSAVGSLNNTIFLNGKINRIH